MAAYANNFLAQKSDRTGNKARSREVLSHKFNREAIMTIKDDNERQRTVFWTAAKL